MTEKKGSKILRDIMMWIILVALFACFTIATIVKGKPSFARPDSIFTIARQVSMIGVASVGMTFVILTGGIDLSVGSIITFVNIICAYMMVNMGISIPVAIIISLLASVAIGFINGFLISTITVPPLIATFAMQTIFAGLAYIICGGMPISGISQSFKFIGQGYIGPTLPGMNNALIPVPVIIMVVCFAIGSFILNKTYFGRYFYAVGGNEDAARLSGIRTTATKYLVYMFSGFFAGLAGIIMLARTGSAQATAGTGYEFDVITCVVLGGVSVNGGAGKMSGVIAGVLVIGVLTSGMVALNIDTYLQMVVKGLVLVLAVGFDCFQKKMSAKA